MFSVRFWQPSNSLCDLQNWLSEKQFVVSVDEFDEGSGEIVAMCGDLKCKFALKAYEYQGYDMNEIQFDV